MHAAKRAVCLGFLFLPANLYNKLVQGCHISQFSELDLDWQLSKSSLVLQAVSFTSFSQKLVYELNFWSCWLTLSVSSDKERRNWYLLSFEEFLSVGLVWIWLWLIKFGKTHYKHHLCLPIQKQILQPVVPVNIVEQTEGFYILFFLVCVHRNAVKSLLLTLATWTTPSTTYSLALKI